MSNEHSVVIVGAGFSGIGMAARLRAMGVEDFVVLDRDITAVVPQKVLAAKVLRTVVGGKTVYEQKQPQ